MVEVNLTTEETDALLEVVNKVKASKAYQNYMSGVGLNLKRAASLKGEGDGFSKVGEVLRSGKIPQFLNATAKGQKKVQDALQAELKQRKLHGILKDAEFNDAIYRELYVKPGSLKDYLGISSQEEQMSEDKEQTEVENDVPAGSAAADNGNDNMVDLPDYYDEEKFKDLEIKVVDGKVSKADFEKLEKRHKEPEKEENDNQPTSPKTEEGNEGDAAAAGSDGSSIEVDGMDGNGPRTTENEDSDWVKKYDAALTRYGQENGNEWVRDNEADENGERPAGLKGKFANGTEVHYADKDKLSVKTPEGEKPNAGHFKEIIALARENGQDIKLGPTMTPEFKAALIEACAKGGVEIQNLSEEDRAVYNGFVPKEEKTEEKKEEKQEKETSYSVKSNVVQSCLGRYSRDLDLDFRNDTDEFENSLRKKEEELKSGVLEGDKEDALKAKILMMKYVEAEYDGDKDKQALYETALQRYGVDSIKRKPENGGSFVVKTKPYGERTEEEKANINAAMEKAFPKKQEMDPAVLAAMNEQKGQTLQ